MHIVNAQGMIGVIEDGAALPGGARKATEAEIAWFETEHDAVAANVPAPVEIPEEAEGIATIETIEYVDTENDDEDFNEVTP